MSRLPRIPRSAPLWPRSGARAWRRRALCGLAGILWLVSPPAAPPALAQGVLPVAALQVVGRAITAEIARTPDTRQRGLMHRRSLPRDHGMLFVYEADDAHCFWMKDTPLPLSIAFIDVDGRIVAIRDMQPYDLSAHCPPQAVRYALEMPQGWFKRAGVRIGDRVTPLPPS